MSGDNILLRETSNGVATITLNRPNQYNALSAELLDALIAELEQIAADESVRLVILAAEGKAFCAGHDLKQMRQSAERAAHHELFSKCSTMMQKIVNLPQPVVARVQPLEQSAILVHFAAFWPLPQALRPLDRRPAWRNWADFHRPASVRRSALSSRPRFVQWRNGHLFAGVAPGGHAPPATAS